EPASLREVKLGLASLDGLLGELVIDGAAGATVSTVQVTDAGVGSVWPSESMARTWKVCEPSARPLYDAGDEQAVNGAASREHSKVAGDLDAENEKLALVEFVIADCEVSSVVSGGVVSTVQVYEAGVASVPTGSVARTWKVCEPSARPE